MKKILPLFILLFSALGFAQKSVNDYKYVILNDHYEFLNKKDEYNLNTLTKIALQQKGFEVYFSNEQFPEDLALNRCAALQGDVLSTGNFMVTELTIVLNDCNGNLVYKTVKGKSKEKNRRKSYYEALREASHSLEALDYKYMGKDAAPSKAVASKTETLIAATPSKRVNNDNLLTASPTSYGYELLDKANRLVLKMYKTAQADYYSAKMETLTGFVFNKDGQWVFEYYDRNDKLVSEKLNIKFN